MRFIIHADDFGKSESVTRAIDEVVMRRLCDETSLMVNMPYANEAVDLARKNGYANRVGMHINLTEGMPLTESIRRCPRFCNSDGSFSKSFHMSTAARFSLTAGERRAVRDELDAQLRRFISYGGLMMRIDSHHHVHTDWSIYRLLVPLAMKYGFKTMRISADMHHVRFDKEIYKQLFNRSVRRHFETTDHFDGAANASRGGFGGTIEVMVHPMFAGGVLCDTIVPYEKAIVKIRQES